MSDRKIAFWFIALLSVLVLVPFLGETIFYSKGEPREAIVAYTMLESGNWILPTNYGVEIAYKPPFLYWTIAVISSVLGGVTEFSARMPSALAFLAMPHTSRSAKSRHGARRSVLAEHIYSITCCTSVC